MPDFNAKMHHKSIFLHRSPDLLAGFKGPTSKRRRREGRGREGRVEKGRGGQGRGGALDLSASSF